MNDSSNGKGNGGEPGGERSLIRGVLRILNRLIEPSATLSSEDLRWRIQLVSGTLLMVIPLTIIGGFAMFSRVGHFPLSHIAAAFVLLFSYVFTRSRFAIFGCVVAVIGLAIPSTFLALGNYQVDPPAAQHALMWLALPVVYSALVLPMVPAIVTAISWQRDKAHRFRNLSKTA